MKIQGPGRVGGTDDRRTERKSSGAPGEFANTLASVRDAGSAPLTHETGGTAGVGGVDALLALQGASESTSEEARRRAKAKGEAILDKLEDLRLDMLAGGVNRGRLEDLSRTVAAERQQTDDPVLDNALSEIETRAAVELAKFERDA